MYKTHPRVWRTCEEGKRAVDFGSLLSCPSPLPAGAHNVVGMGENELTQALAGVNRNSSAKVIIIETTVCLYRSEWL